jgi:hypothetical protein
VEHKAGGKNNSPDLLVSSPVFFAAEHGEYSNTHRVQRLEYGQISRAILGELFFSTGLGAVSKLGFLFKFKAVEKINPKEYVNILRINFFNQHRNWAKRQFRNSC